MCEGGEEGRHQSKKPEEWATWFVYLADLGLLLLFTADTHKPFNERSAQKRMVGLPTHRPWCHKPRLDWAIWHDACRPSNPQPPSRRVSYQPNTSKLLVYLSVCLSRHRQPSWIYCFICCHFYFCLVWRFVHLCLSWELSLCLSRCLSICCISLFLSLSRSLFWSYYHSHALMQQTQHDVSHICWIQLNKEAFSTPCLHYEGCIWIIPMKQRRSDSVQYISNIEIAEGPRSNCYISIFILRCMHESATIVPLMPPKPDLSGRGPLKASCGPW